MANFKLSDPLVIDTSVAINLEATGIPSSILLGLARSVRIVDIVPGELEGGRGRGAQVLTAIAEWQRKDLVAFDRLSDEANNTFEALIVGPAAETLDDGEAATIAHALDIGGVAVIDEAKARRIASERFKSLPIASSVDLILNPAVIKAIGEDEVSEAIFSALTKARMRVPAERHDDILRIIAQEKLVQCHSLPGSLRRRT